MTTLSDVWHGGGIDAQRATIRLEELFYSIVVPNLAALPLVQFQRRDFDDSESTCGLVDGTYLSSLTEGTVPELRRMFRKHLMHPSGNDHGDAL